MLTLMVIFMMMVFFYECDEVNFGHDVELNVHVGNMMMKMFEAMLMFDLNVDDDGYDDVGNDDVWC